MAAPPPIAAGGNPAGTLAAFAAVSCTYFATIGLFNPYAPLWFKSLGFSTLAIGSIASLQSWTRILAPYAWSWFGDHGGQRVALLRLAACGSLVAALALWGAESYARVAVVTALLFVFNGGVVPLSEAALARHLGATGQMDAGRYGRVRVWGSIGFIVAVMAGGAILERFGIEIFPYLVAGLYLALLGAALRLHGRPEAGPEGGAVPPVWPLLRQPEVRWFFASVFFTVLAHSSLYAFFSLYLDSLGYSKAAVGALWAVSVLFEIALFWFQGHWFGRLSARAWLALAAGVTALRFAATAGAAQSLAVLVVAQASHALTFAAHHAACIVTVNRHFPGRLRGRGQALYTTLGYGASGVIGGVGGGWLIAHLGFAAVFWAAVLAALVGLACAWRMAPAHAVA